MKVNSIWIVIVLGFFVITLSSCRTLTGRENDILDREKDKIHEPKNPEGNF